MRLRKARPPGTAERLHKWVRRRPARTALIGGAFLLGLALLAGVLWLEARRQTQDDASALVARNLAEQEAEVRRGQEQMQQERQKRRDSYVRDVGLAWRAWEAGRLDDVLAALELSPPALDRADPEGPGSQRSFEWYLLSRLALPQRRLIRNSSPLYCLAFSPDGTTCASGHFDGIVRLWDPATGRLRLALPGRPLAFHTIAFSPDGKWLACGGARCDAHGTGEIVLWDLAAPTSPRSLGGPLAIVNSLSFSPDGKLLASGSYDGTLRLWDLADGREVALLPHPLRSLWCLAFSPDGSLLASGSKDRKVRLWETRTWGELPLPEATHRDTVHSLAFAPDGGQLAAGYADGTPSVWRRDTKEGSGFLPAGGPSCRISALAFSPEGKTLATVHDREGSVRLWRVGNWEELAVLGNHKAGARAAAFAPDGKTLVVGHVDGVVRLWHVATGRELLAFRGSGAQVNSLAFAPDGRTLAAAFHDGFLKGWRAATDDEIRQAEQWERDQ